MSIPPCDKSCFYGKCFLVIINLKTKNYSQSSFTQSGRSSCLFIADNNRKYILNLIFFKTTEINFCDKPRRKNFKFLWPMKKIDLLMSKQDIENVFQNEAY